ncbi:MAG: ASCH domain-containing protein [Nitrososphaerota archaeon]
MRCLSLKQPYAELVVSCKMTIEVRTWNTNFRGQFLVHAPKKINEEACKRLKIDQSKLVTGAIVGKANLYDVIPYGSKKSFINDKNKHFAGSNYEKPKYGFLVNHAKKFDFPIPIRGKLGFFNVALNGFRLTEKSETPSR